MFIVHTWWLVKARVIFLILANMAYGWILWLVLIQIICSSDKRFSESVKLIWYAMTYEVTWDDQEEREEHAEGRRRVIRWAVYSIPLPLADHWPIKSVTAIQLGGYEYKCCNTYHSVTRGAQWGVTTAQVSNVQIQGAHCIAPESWYTSNVKLKITCLE